MKTKYPITDGSRVYYADKEGKVRSGYAMKMGVSSNGVIQFYITHVQSKDAAGEWVDRERLR